MPPPPPPSKSYLLVIDTDSEDEEEEDYYRQPPPLVRPPPPPPQPAVVVAPSSNPISEKDIIAESAMRIRRPESTNTTVTNNPKSNNKNRRSQHVVDEDEEEDEDDDDNSEDSKDNINITTTTVTPTTVLSPEEEQDSLEKKLTKTQKKNKKRRKKKKSKRDLKEEGSEVMVSSPANNNNQTNSTNSRATTTTTKKKLLSFSNVSIRCYERCFGSDTVPIDGGWPLGSELYKFQDSEDMTIEEFENMKQHNLKERWESIQCSGKIIDERIIKRLTERPSSSSSSSSGAAVTSTATGCGDDNNDDGNNDEIPPFVFETRQWDFLSGHKNPLFRPLLEEERQELFLRYSTPTAEDNNTNNNKDSSADHMSYTTINSKRSRSSSISSMSDISVGSNGGQTSSCGGSSNTRRKSRSNSVSSSPCQFNETYNQVYVHHVRNELEQLRNDRTKSGATGCNCRKLTVYLPPKDGSGGKKAQHRRMKPSKVVNELKKRNMYNPNKKSSREELERTLHDAVEKEPCCIGNDCFCIRNGIECQADACSCWHDSHVHTKSGGGVGGDKKKKDSTLSVQEIKNRCGNPLGTMVVDIAGIDNFRSMILSSGGICQPVDMSI